MRVNAPNLLAVVEPQTVEHALCPKRVDLAARDDRAGARPGVEPEAVVIGRRVAEGPDRFAGLGLERLDDVLVTDAVEQDDASVGHRDIREAVADFLLPQDRRP